MHKNFLRTLSLLTLILSHSADALPYDDDKGHHAPATVRRTADELASYWSRWQQYYKAQSITLKTTEPDCCFWEKSVMQKYHVTLGGTAEKPSPKAWSLAAGSRWNYSEGCSQEQADAAYQNLGAQWMILLRVVNENVAQGVAYEGDMKLNLKFNMW